MNNEWGLDGVWTRPNQVQRIDSDNGGARSKRVVQGKKNSWKISQVGFTREEELWIGPREFLCVKEKGNSSSLGNKILSLV